MLDKKVIVITGACGLIGREFVQTCLKNNAKVVLADISEEAGNKFLAELDNPSAFFVKTDITNEESVDSLISQSVSKFGKIDAIVNNAYPRNKDYGKKVEDVSFASFNENVSMHLGGYFLCMKKFAQFFKTQGFGNVVSMGSIYGVMAPRFEIYAGTEMTMPVEYAAIKSAVIHLTKYFASYYKDTKIRFNAISPGGIFNDQPKDFVEKYNKYAPMLKKDGLNETLIFLLSDDSIGKNGENFVVDNGWSEKGTKGA
ncbi:MAG: SDR family oxidoreductase [Bacteroidia bacterium]|nr:SDR family oxidoreductase [Bacteroidia bacterium]